MKKEKIENWEKGAKTFLGDWEILDNGRMRRVVLPQRIEWVRGLLEAQRQKTIEKAKGLLNKHDKIVWNIALSELLKLKPKPAKDSWLKFWLKNKKREFIVYRIK